MRSMALPNRSLTALVAVLLALIVVAPAGPVTAGSTELIRDIRSGPKSSNPEQLTKSSDMIFFTVRNAEYGDYRLWRTRGTRSSTRWLTARENGEIYSLQNVEGTLAYVPEEALRLRNHYLTSDGTRKGTGIFDPDIDDRVAILLNRYWAKLHGNWLYAGRRSGSNSLLRSDDGTLEGGTVLREFPGSDSSRYLVGNVTRAGGLVFFYANDGVHGRELWRSDGTEDGTRLVKDILPGEDSSKPNHLTAVGDKLFFTAITSARGRELWVSDGTTRGTWRVKDIWPGKKGSQPKGLTRLGTKLMFVADDGKSGRELWKSNGTRAGTKRVKDIKPGRKSSAPTGLTAVSGRLYFSAADGKRGPELWRSSGSSRSTKIVKDIWRGAKGSRPMGLTRLGTKLVFTADHPAYGRELWRHKR